MKRDATVTANPTITSGLLLKSSLFIILSSILSYYYLLLYTDPSTTILSHHHNPQRILWVIAHPDDESLFFSSTILSLLQSPSRPIGHLLSLSNGNGDGLGTIRAKELKDSCRELGIMEEENCIALNDPDLQDSMTVWWEATIIQARVKEYVVKWGIDLIITFDDYGISGHTNHQAISHALTKASQQNPTTFPPLYQLISPPLIMKYSSLLLLPYSLITSYLEEHYPLLSNPTPSSSSSSSSSSRRTTTPEGGKKRSRVWFVNNRNNFRRGKLSFERHESQTIWFRSIFMKFSRLMWVAEIVEVI